MPLWGNGSMKAISFKRHRFPADTFYTQRHLIGRPTLRRFRSDAEAAWAAATA
jgi:hypothetical protein